MSVGNDYDVIFDLDLLEKSELGLNKENKRRRRSSGIASSGVPRKRQRTWRPEATEENGERSGKRRLSSYEEEQERAKRRRMEVEDLKMNYAKEKASELRRERRERIVEREILGRQDVQISYARSVEELEKEEKERRELEKKKKNDEQRTPSKTPQRKKKRRQSLGETLRRSSRRSALRATDKIRYCFEKNSVQGVVEKQEELKTLIAKREKERGIQVHVSAEKRKQETRERLAKEEQLQAEKEQVRDEIRSALLSRLGKYPSPFSVLKTFLPKTTLEKNASSTALKRSLKRAMAHYHPDRQRHTSIKESVEAEEIYKILGETREKL